MPYITKEDRATLAAGLSPQTVGQLNYSLTTMVVKGGYSEAEYRQRLDLYIAQQGGVNYTNINAVFGVVMCMLLELIRRKKAPLIPEYMKLKDAAMGLYEQVGGPYEDTKIAANGDVFP